MDLLLMGAIVLLAIVIVMNYRNNRDRQLLAQEADLRGGTISRVTRAKKGHPFPDTGRGWWVWRVEWQKDNEPRVAHALTTREGVQQWVDQAP